MTGDELKKLRNGDCEIFERIVRDNQENVYRLILTTPRSISAKKRAERLKCTVCVTRTIRKQSI